MQKLVCSVLLLGVMNLGAQVSVEVSFDQDNYLAGEKIVAAVRITNRSGQTLKLGTEPDWLTFSVENSHGLVLASEGDPPVLGEFDLESSKRATRRVELTPWYPLTIPNRYSVTAQVKFKEWGFEKASPPKSFNIISGARIWEQEFGIPGTSADDSGVPEVRRYVLQQANFIKSNLRLYLKVTDYTGERIIRVLPIGPLVSFSKPEAQVDQASHLHVLYMDGPQSFSYTSYNPDGDLVLRQNYIFTESRPRLRLKDGKVAVSGGARRESSRDIPPPKEDREGTERPESETTAPAEPGNPQPL